MSTNMRGLNTFITDIRHCSNKEQEQKRIEKELAKIRNKFTNQKGLSGYQKKKYVWKLLYIHILGYDVDFGHNECTTLINSPKFSEKYTGYVATSILVSEQNNELFRSIAASVKNDLNSVNEINQSLALAMVGAQAPKELVDELHSDVQKLALQESRTSLFIRKKACLCLLRMFRKYKDKFQPQSWASSFTQMFEQRYISLGFITSAVSLLLGICQLAPSQPYEDCVPRLIKILHKLAILKDFPLDYNYYATPSPWLQVKLLRLLTYFPPPQPNTEAYKQLNECLTRVIKKTEVTKSVNKNNADHGILFEAANLVITYGGAVGMDLKNDILKLLGIFISVKEPNLRYLGLETMCKFALISVDQIEDHLNTIFKSLRDNDISIRKRALELLYLMSTPNTSVRIVEEMLSYAESGADMQIKDDLVLKIAILAEKFADNLYWYVDVIVRMINSSGDFVTEDIWFRIIQIIIGFSKDANSELQRYAAQKIFQALSVPHVHETLVCIGAFVLSEFSNFLVEQGKEPQKIFDILNKHFPNSSEKGRQMLLNAFVKLGSKYEDLRDQSMMICQMSGEHFDPDVQQRGIEYFSLLLEEDRVQQQVLSKMPPYSESLQSNNPLLKRIYNLKLGKNEYKDPTLINQAKKQAQEEVEKMQNKLQPTKVNQDAINKHVDWLKQCPYLQYCADQICLEGHNIIVPTSDNILKGNTSVVFSNVNELKALLSSPNGKVVDNPDLAIQYKSEFQGHMGKVKLIVKSKIALQFEPQNGPMSNLSIMVAQTNGLLFNISPVKQGDFPQVLIQVMSNDGAIQLPIASIFYEAGGVKRQLEFALPIFSNKFTQMVDMPYQRFTQFFEEYTTNQTNPNYFKLDTFIRNPAPASVPMIEVLKRIGGLLTSALNLKAQPYPSLENITHIWACGQFLLKPPEQTNVLNFPIMVMVQSFENVTKEYLRVSIRCGGSGEIAKNTLNLINLYMS